MSFCPFARNVIACNSANTQISAVRFLFYVYLRMSYCNKIITKVYCNVLRFSLLALGFSLLSPLRIGFLAASYHLVDFNAMFFAPNFSYFEANSFRC